MFVIPEDKHSILADIMKGSDRVTAIVGCAYIEEALKARLKTLFGHDKDAFKNVFGHSGPLGSLAHQSRFAYTAKVINSVTRNKIEAIGRIRNMFAHRSGTLSFDHADLEPDFKLLGKPRSYMLEAGRPSKGRYKIDGLSPRDYFLANLQDITDYLDSDGDGAPKTHRGVLMISSRGKSTRRPARQPRKRG